MSGKSGTAGASEPIAMVSPSEVIANNNNHRKEHVDRLVKALGSRVVQVQAPTGFTNGVQVQHVEPNGKVERVRPGTELELLMFDMLVRSVVAVPCDEQGCDVAAGEK